jgi:isopentenyl diphosphate isomerase/L-lactate dehydrogenase-like FMN-dependent dehydrogenase
MPNRRAFLKFLAGSPLLARFPSLFAGQLAQSPDVIANPRDAINVFELEAAARKKLPPAHFGYMATGVDSDLTLKANLEGYSHYQLRPRRLVDVSQIDMSTEILGTKWPTPIVIAPVGSQKAFHPEGEVAVARAARAKNTLQILSTVTTSSVEEVTEARGAPVWYQLYPTNKWEATQKLVKRAEAAGCPVLVFTVDLLAGRNTETQTIFRRLDSRQCSNCHAADPGAVYSRKPMFAGIDTTGLALGSPALTWEFVRRLKDLTSMKLVVKGIETSEDASLCLKYGVDGIIVSNHGGRAEESGRATIDSLPDVVRAVGNRIPVLVDGGIRRGTDVFKALALGAHAVGIGRPYVWGLAAFGQAGVEQALEILHREFELAMKQCGAPSIQKISPNFVIPSGHHG